MQLRGAGFGWIINSAHVSLPTEMDSGANKTDEHCEKNQSKCGIDEGTQGSNDQPMSKKKNPRVPMLLAILQ